MIIRHWLSAIIFCLPGACFGGVIVSSFGPGNAYDLHGGLSISTAGSANAYETAMAVSFTPSATFNLGQINLALGYVSGTNSFVVELVNDNGGPIGSVIETWTFSAPAFDGPDLNTLTPTSSVALSSGTPYWIVVLPGAGDTYGAWNHPSPDTFVGGQATSHDRGANWYPPVVTAGVPSFDVHDTTEDTPEPGSLLLAAIGFAGLAIASMSVRRIRSEPAGWLARLMGGLR